jgi:hypothetical protein
MRTRGRQQEWQIAECLLPGLTLPIAEEMAQRVKAELAGRPRPGVSFLGSLLMPGDEVLMCLSGGAAIQPPPRTRICDCWRNWSPSAAWAGPATAFAV